MSSTLPQWIRDASGLSVSAVARELGLTAGSRRSWGPCPACRADRRGSSDRRGPIGVDPDDRGWCCHRCDARGSALILVALAVTGSRRCTPEVRAWLEQGGRIVPQAPHVERPRPEYPDRAEVEGLWSRCGPCDTGGYVTRWLESRGLHPRRCRDLVRWLPGRDLPTWAAHWPYLGAWAVLPLVDATGAMRSMQGRAVVADAPRKSVAARGSRRALVLASPGAVEVLRGGDRRRVVIAEGEPDYLTHASRGEAVIGIPGPGAWSVALASRLRDCEVVVRVHEDTAGRGYARMIVPTLAGCRVHVLQGLQEGAWVTESMRRSM